MAQSVQALLLQAGSPQVQFPMVLQEFIIDLMPLAAHTASNKNE
jgi:hypothetical protein